MLVPTNFFWNLKYPIKAGAYQDLTLYFPTIGNLLVFDNPEKLVRDIDEEDHAVKTCLM